MIDIYSGLQPIIIITGEVTIRMEISVRMLAYAFIAVACVCVCVSVCVSPAYLNRSICSRACSCAVSFRLDSISPTPPPHPPRPLAQRVDKSTGAQDTQPQDTVVAHINRHIRTRARRRAHRQTRYALANTPTAPHSPPRVKLFPWG